MVARVPDQRLSEGYVVMPGVVPRLEATPGAIAHAGGALGADTTAVYGDLLGMSEGDIAQLRDDGVI
jgi:crotonobetainyl-CoA:carnitine CoA-transferase CaiB-like acyl-CoA transferase